MSSLHSYTELWKNHWPLPWSPMYSANKSSCHGQQNAWRGPGMENGFQDVTKGKTAFHRRISQHLWLEGTTPPRWMSNISLLRAINPSPRQSRWDESQGNRPRPAPRQPALPGASGFPLRHQPSVHLLYLISRSQQLPVLGASLVSGAMVEMLQTLLRTLPSSQEV